jgi:hypothetical protein
MPKLRISRRDLFKVGALAAAASSMIFVPVRALNGGRTYVLVRGAWFGGFVWRPVADALCRMATPFIRLP